MTKVTTTFTETKSPIPLSSLNDYPRYNYRVLLQWNYDRHHTIHKRKPHGLLRCSLDHPNLFTKNNLVSLTWDIKIDS